VVGITQSFYLPLEYLFILAVVSSHTWPGQTHLGHPRSSLCIISRAHTEIRNQGFAVYIHKELDLIGDLATIAQGIPPLAVLGGQSCYAWLCEIS